MMIKRALLVGATLVIVALLVGMQHSLAGEGADLSLDQEQSEAVGELRAAYLEQAWALHGELLALRAELRDLWATDEPDLDAILAKQSELNELSARLRTARAEFGVAALEQLTPEQRAAHAEILRRGACPHPGAARGVPASARPASSGSGVWL